MKELNRREFLTLSGASVALLALAACGGAPSTPVVPTGKEAKVLEAINLYRGELSPLTLDSGLDPAMELVVKIAKGEVAYNQENMETLGTLITNYNGVCAPIGIGMDNDDEDMRAIPVCVYSDNAEEMAQNLKLQAAGTNLNSPAIKLVNIKTFEHNGVTYWVALIAESKK